MKTVFALVVSVFSFGNVAFAQFGDFGDFGQTQVAPQQQQAPVAPPQQQVQAVQFADPLTQLDAYQFQEHHYVKAQMADVDAKITALGTVLDGNLGTDIVLYIRQENMSKESLFYADMYNYAMDIKRSVAARRAIVQTEFEAGSTDSSNGRVCILLGLGNQAIQLFYRAIGHYSYCKTELMQIYMDVTFADGIVKFIRTTVPKFP